jgi:GNAT superfamily N-acetyltransferase
MPKTYLVPHVGCPTFESVELPSDTVSQGLVAVVEVLDAAERSRLCESVLRELPEWFGLPEANAAYVRDVAALPMLAVEDKGFVALRLHGPKAGELYVMGVRPEHQGCGLGTALVAAAEGYLREQGVEYLQVKTLGPSRPSQAYERTRGFYEARGFVPLEELHGLWEGNPCLLMVKRL